MKKREKISLVISSTAAIVLAGSIIAGGTYALFTNESKTNIAVTSGKVDVEATISDLVTYSGVDLTGDAASDTISETAEAGKFTNGGTATITTDGDLKLVNVTPGDKVTFKIKVTNKSNVVIKYRTIISCDEDDDLFSGLEFTIGGSTFDGLLNKSKWVELGAGAGISSATLECSVILPTDAENIYQDKSCKVSYIVEAVQGNAYITDEEESNKNLGITPVFDDENGTVTYGLYPQTHVSDGATVSGLNALVSPESNGWYLYNDEYYAKESANPYRNSYKFNDGTTIVKGTEYWFKCEPIEWKILKSSNDSYSLVSTVLLNAHKYESYSNNYENSEIRSWLNNDFLNTAFNLNSSFIQTTTVDNSASTTNSSSNSYACVNTEDKVYLLSYQDYLNADYGFSTTTSSTTTRTCKPTDYALANYCYQYSGNGSYWTRSPSSESSSIAWYVNDVGLLSRFSNSVSNASFGVRPAITIKL